MTEKISIIIPIYNVEKYIHKCIESVLDQTHTNLEIILVDDGSPDNCPIICDEYARKDSRIKVIHKSNGGLSDARNAGLNIATGDYIGFVDSDDWVAKDMFEYLLEGIQKYNADISVCNLFYVNKHRYNVKDICPDKVMTSYEVLEKIFQDKIECYAWNKLYRRELWRNIEYPVGQNFEDLLTIYKVVECAKKVVFLEKPKYYYLQREDSISGTRDYNNRFHMYQAICKRYEDVIKRYPQFSDDLVRRIALYYSHELSYEIVMKKSERYLNMNLLKILSEFIKRNERYIFTNSHLDFFSKKKMQTLSLGTIKGCKKVLMYRKMEVNYRKICKRR